MATHTRTHVLIGFANPYFKCDECKQPVPYWHNPNRCDCEGKTFNSPCGHEADITSVCPTWDPVEGCGCYDSINHDKV
jgi:Zn finger protein HypA/HybF involved in hydrogenase expression